MREQEKPQFVLLITSVGEMYDKALNPFLLELYWNVLKTFELQEIKLGINRHLKNPDVGMFLPKPADIIAAIAGDTKAQALQAWTKVVDAMKYVGVYESLVFDDAVIHAVIRDMGGWQKLCMTRAESLPFISNEFQSRYRAYLNHKPTHYPRYLVGIAESQNSAAGFNFSEPVLFGDRAKAQQILNVEGGVAKANVPVIPNSISNSQLGNRHNFAVGNIRSKLATKSKSSNDTILEYQERR